MHETPPLSTSRFIILVAGSFVSGCTLAPYEEAFQCPLSSNYGACTDVSGAYADAVTAPALAPDNARRTHREPGVRSRSWQRVGARSAPHFHAASVELATPSVIPPALLRTRVGAYQDTDGTLFAPRYVFHMAGVATISGDVHRAARSPVDTHAVSPLLLPTAPR